MFQDRPNSQSINPHLNPTNRTKIPINSRTISNQSRQKTQPLNDYANKRISPNIDNSYQYKLSNTSQKKHYKNNSFNNESFTEQSQSALFPKMRQPQFVQKEKENLQDEIRLLKNQLKEVKEENKKVRISNVMLEKEIGQYEAIIDEMKQPQNKQKEITNYQQQNLLIQKMRAKYKEVKFRLLLKEKELERFRKNSKLTKLQEIDVAAIFIELDLYRSECKRLKEVCEAKSHSQEIFFNQLVSSDQKTASLPQNVLSNLILDNENMFQQIKKWKQQMQEINKQTSALNKEKNIYYNDLNRLHRLNQDKDSEIANLNRRIKELENQNNQFRNYSPDKKKNEDKSSKVVQQMKTSLQEQTNQIEALNDKIINQQKKIVDMEFRLKLAQVIEESQKIDQRQETQQSQGQSKTEVQNQIILNQSFVQSQKNDTSNSDLKVQKVQKNKNESLQSTERNKSLIQTPKQEVKPKEEQNEKGQDAQIIKDKKASSREKSRETIRKQKIEIKEAHQAQSQTKPEQKFSQRNDIANSIHEEMRRKRMKMLSQFQQAEQYFMNNDLEMQNIQRWQKRFRKVNFADIEGIARQLKFRLMNYGINSKDMDRYLIPEKLRLNKCLTLLELEFLLQQKYFELTPDSARLFSRYLTEDNSEEYIYFDGEKSQEIEIIKSVMRKAVGKFEAISKEEEEEIIRNNCELISKFKLSIIDTINMLKYSSKGKAKQNNEQNVCSTDDFQSAIKFCDLNLSQRTMELIWLIGFNNSNNIDKVII